MARYSANRQRSSFGQRVSGYSTRRSESSGGGGGYALSIRWNNRWKPFQNVTTKLRLLTGSYLGLEGEENEYFPYVEHYVARSNRSCICSKQYQIVDGELTTVGGKCLACQERDNGAEDISWRLMHAFNAIHLAWYHLEPVFDDQGRPVNYTKGDRQGEQVMRKVLCEGRRCKYCKEGLEKVFGKKVHWSVGSGHLQDLAGFVTEIEKDCANCGEGRLEDVAYECPECGHILVDIATCELDDKGLASYVARKQECPECKKRGYPLKQTECSKCQDPTPLSIFDCELEIKRQGEGTNSTIQIPRWKACELDKELEEMAKPYNFKKVFAPDPFEWQAKILKIRNPYGKDDPDDHAGEYGDDADPDYSE